jgi:beta-galactosidase/beta-glucuronidase
MHNQIIVKNKTSGVTEICFALDKYTPQELEEYWERIKQAKESGKLSPSIAFYLCHNGIVLEEIN